MPTPTKGPRFGGSPSHQRLIMANLAQALFVHGKITTTEAKAKRLRPYAEHLITKAKVDTVANRRQVAKVIRDKEALHILFTQVGPNYVERNGGYTRITKVAPRKGDNAPMAVIELVEAGSGVKPKTAKKAAAPKAEKKAAPKVEEAKVKEAEAVEEAAAEVVEEATEEVAEAAEAPAENVAEEAAAEEAGEEETPAKKAPAKKAPAKKAPAKKAAAKKTAEKKDK